MSFGFDKDVVVVQGVEVEVAVAVALRGQGLYIFLRNNSSKLQQHSGGGNDSEEFVRERSFIPIVNILTTRPVVSRVSGEAPENGKMARK